MSSIDERIVKLDLDNKDFEKNASVSMKTLDRIKEALNFGTTSNEKSLSGISTAVENISSRFSNMGIVGMAALQNLTNSAINLGKNLVSKVFNPIVEGGKKRALNIEDAKFQLEGLGIAWKDISDDIDYGVKDTAYGLDSAAKAASSLVASGVQVGDSMKTALRGISGVAAMTNAQYEEIAPIFTTVAGQGKLMTMQLRQLETRGLNAAAVIGKQLGKTEAEVRDMVTKGKIDFETFASAMDSAFGEHAKDANKTFSGAMSNVRAALARTGAMFATPIIQNAIPVLNALREKINAINKAIKRFAGVFEVWIKDYSEKITKFINNIKIDDKTTGFIDILAANLSNVKIIIEQLFSIFKKTFNDFFPKTLTLSNGKVLQLSKSISSRLYNAFDKINTFLWKIREFIEKNENKIQRTFKGIFAIFDIGITILKKFGKILSPVLGIFGEKAGGILDVTAAIGDFLVKLSEAIKKSKTLETIFGAVSSALSKLKNILSSVRESASGFFEDLKNKFSLKDFSKNILNVLNGLKDGITNVFDSADIDKAAKTGLLGLLVYYAKKLKDNVYSLKQLFSGEKTSVWVTIKETMGQLKSTLFAWEQDLNASRLLKIGGAIAILAIGLLILSSIPADKLAKATTAMAGLFGMLMGSLKIFEKYFDEKKMIKLSMSSKVFTKLATAILILSIAMKILASLSWEGIAKGVVSMAAICGMIIGTSFLLSKNEGTLKKGAKGLMSFALSMIIFGAAFKIFESIGWSGIIKSLISIGGIITVISIFAAVTKNSVKDIKKLASSMVIFGISMVIFAKAFKDFSSLDLKGIGLALLAMAGIFTEILIVCAINKKIGDSQIMKLGASLILIGIAMKILANVMTVLSELDLKGIGLGLLAMGGMLAIITLAANLMPQNLISVAAGMTLMAIAIKILTSSLVILGKMSIGDIIKGVLTIAGMFVVLGAAAAILQPLLPAMAALAGILALTGIAAVTLAAGLILLAKAIVLLGAAVGANFAVTYTIINGFLDLLPKFGEKLASFFVSFLQTTANFTPEIMDAFGTLLLGILEKITEYVPKFVDMGLTLLLSLLHSIDDNIQEITYTALSIITHFIEGIAEGLPDLIDAGHKLIIAYIDGLATAIDENTDALIAAMDHLGRSILDALVKVFTHYVPKIKEKARELILKAKDAIKEKIDTWKDAAKDLVDGFIQGIKDKIQSVVNTVKDLGSKVVNGLKDFLGIHSPSKIAEDIGKFFDMGLVNGLVKYTKLASDASEDLGQSTIDSLNDSLSGISKVFTNEDDFTIKPILDLSDINKKKKQLDSIFTNNRTISLVSSLGNNSIDDRNNSSKSISTFNFTQNNYSPKALSSIDIYRQTRNQFSQMKELIS